MIDQAILRGIVERKELKQRAIQNRICPECGREMKTVGSGDNLSIRIECPDHKYSYYIYTE